MNWKTSSYNMQTSGDYAVTRHAVMTAPGGYFYIAWHGKDELGTFDNASDAKAACEQHAMGYARKEGRK